MAEPGIDYGMETKFDFHAAVGSRENAKKNVEKHPNVPECNSFQMVIIKHRIPYLQQ